MELTFSINQLADFGAVTHQTMRRKLKSAEAQAEPNGEYSLPTVIQALLNSNAELREEKLKLIRVQRELKESELAEREGRLVEVELVGKFYDPIFIAIRQHIAASSMSREEQEDLLFDLRDITNDGYNEKHGFKRNQPKEVSSE
jgi:hypothetical protein